MTLLCSSALLSTAHGEPVAFIDFIKRSTMFSPKSCPWDLALRLAGVALPDHQYLELIG